MEVNEYESLMVLLGVFREFRGKEVDPFMVLVHHLWAPGGV